MTIDKGLVQVYAGDQARKHIQAHGLQASDIKVLLGASSGPKWLVLHGIDVFLQQQFLKDATQPIELLGTSAGAWRMASYAHRDCIAAHARLTEAYVEQRYSEKPDGHEILTGCRQVIRQLLGEDGAEAILSDTQRHLNIIVTQCHGLTAHANKQVKTLGFGAAALANRVSRKTLSWQFTRILLHNRRSDLFSTRLNDLPTRYVDLFAGNLEDALLATGSIPVIIEGVKDLAGEGEYQDGGITDYAFDLPILPKDGFVLFPHFTDIPVPGWFDKGWVNQYRPWRTPKRENYTRTIMLVPSKEFIASLPYGKIPDRHDFINLNDQQRIKYWREVLVLTKRLGEDLATMDWANRVAPLPW